MGCFRNENNKNQLSVLIYMFIKLQIVLTTDSAGAAVVGYEGQGQSRAAEPDYI